MNKLIKHNQIFRDNLMLILGLCLSFYFCYHTIQGERSFVRLMQINQEIAVQTHMNDLLTQEHAALETKVKMMRPGSIDPDLLEEQVRVVLGYKHPDEVVVLVN